MPGPRPATNTTLPWFLPGKEVVNIKITKATFFRSLPFLHFPIILDLNFAVFIIETIFLIMDNSRMQNLTVQLNGISFYDADSSFTVASATSAEKGNITIVGYLKGGIPGEVIEAKGFWRKNKKNEPCFYAESFTKTLPITESGVLQFLNSGLIEGLDSKLAKTITNMFGAKTFDVLTHNAGQLMEIASIDPDKAALIAESWQKHLAILKLMDFLHSVSVSPAFAAPIFNKLGHKALECIHDNPFVLVPQIEGLGFITAARIARQLDINPNNLDHVQYGLFAILENMARKGHTCYPYLKLLTSSIKKLGLKPNLVAEAIAQCAVRGQIVFKDLNDKEQDFVINNKAIYLEHIYHCEKELAESLKRHMSAPLNPQFQTPEFNNVIDTLPDTHPEVKSTIKAALSQKCLILDESSRCKKRYFMQALEQLGMKTGLKVCLTAGGPKIVSIYQDNSQRLQNINTLLGYNAATGQYTYNAQTPLDCDIMFIARASMIDIAALQALMRALPPRAAIIISGDNNHLPPHGPGRVFFDLIACAQIPVASLKNADIPQGSLCEAAELVNKGKMPVLPAFKPFERRELNFYFIEQDTPEKIFKTVAGLYTRRLPKAMGYNLLDIQVVSLCKKGPVSAKKLNLFLQERLNKRVGGLKHNGFIFKVNDKVVQVNDNLAKDAIEGQTGIIKSIDMYKKELCVKFSDEHMQIYHFHELSGLKPAYALPINKIGGYQYKIIILPLHCDSYSNLNRMALYSAFLSATEMLIIVGQKRAFKIALNNLKSETRYTGLKELLLT